MRISKLLCTFGIASALIFGGQTTAMAQPSDSVTEDDIRLIALVTMAEAEGEPEEGQRLVIDTILNRMDSDKFPNTASGVIYQRGQFSCMWDGRVEECYVQDALCDMVEEELANRTDGNVIFFRTRRYSDYGTPLFKLGSHYFSGC